MKTFARLAAALLATTGMTAAHAQIPPGNPEAATVDPATQKAAAIAQLELAPDFANLKQIVQTLQNQPGLAPETTDAVSALAKEAGDLDKSGREAEARRALSHAAALLIGRGWDAKDEFAASLAVRPALPVADTSAPVPVLLSQSFPVQYVPQPPGLRLKLSLIDSAASGPATAPRPLGVYDMPRQDFNDIALRVGADCRGIPVGNYILVAEILSGDTLIGETRSTITLVTSPEVARAAIEQRLGKIKGHDDTKASVIYPFDLIRAVNAGSPNGSNYDYAAGFARSSELLDALERGRDLLYRAKGDQRRHYYFTETGEVSPYRLYVPSNWAPGKKLPLIVALHGGGLDENNMLTRGGGIMEKLAEQYGYIVVGPMGYTPFAGYGVPPALPAGAQSGGLGLPLGGTPKRIQQLSEDDVINVLDRVSAEYDVDRSRIYLTGNSMGGGGVWLLGAKFAERFAAAAPCASSLDIRGIAFDRFKSLPLLTCVGALDSNTRKNVAQFGVAQIKAAGGDATYIEIPGGTHGTSIEIVMPQFFAFFAQHQKQP